MPDIQMCVGAAITDAEPAICNRRDACYRFTAKPSEWQAFGPPGEGFTQIDGCSNFIPNERGLPPCVPVAVVVG